VQRKNKRVRRGAEKRRKEKEKKRRRKEEEEEEEKKRARRKRRKGCLRVSGREDFFSPVLEIRRGRRRRGSSRVWYIETKIWCE
jgi:hypothetical protein